MLNYNLLGDEGILITTPTGALEELDFAAVSDNTILTIAPRIADHFVNAEVKHFESADREAALAWAPRAAGRESRLVCPHAQPMPG